MPSKTTPPLWRRAFLRALYLTANATLSAHRAGIDKSTAYQSRKASPLFARLWDQALADGRAATAAGHVPPEVADSDQRPLTIRSNKSGHVCVMATGEGRWNEEVEAEFFAALAATGNVKAAARAIGMSTTALYNRRKLWPAFDTRWQEVVALASERLAIRLLTSASNLLDPPELPVPDMEPMSVDQAIRVAQLYEGRRRNNGDLKRTDPRRAPVDVEAVKAEIIRKAALLLGKPA
ncbi:MAG: helix-turn-helix domain-containing protein [Sphingorhabdus sp.]